MLKKALIVLFLTLFIMLTINSGEKSGMQAKFQTNYGNFTCELYYKNVPLIVANFVGLVEGTREYRDSNSGKKMKKPFYNGLIFHRIIDGFMIQGGCPLGTGTGDPGYKLIDQFDPTLKHDSAGILSMANSGPDTNGSQFFITLNAQPHLDGRHVVFGKVIEGMDVVKKIGSVQTGANDKPAKDVIIKSIKIIRNDSAAKKFNAEQEFAKQDEILKERAKVLEEKRKNFLKELGIKSDNIIKTASGLEYVVVKKGKDKKPKSGQTIVAHYAGYLSDGTKFDSSYDRGQPFETQIGIGRVIKGWDEALTDMMIGEKRILIIPYYLAYGERGYPGVIPPKATLIFEVELIAIK